MGKRLEVSEDFYAEDFIKAASSQRDKRVYVRLLALHHIQQGYSYAAAGKQLCVHWRSVQEWMKRYKLGGLSGLNNRSGQGKKPLLNEGLAQEFKARFVAHQEARAGGRLTGKDAQALLKHWFSVSYSQTSIYRLLHRIGLSWISGRDIHPQADQVAQTDFKKTSSQRYNRRFRTRLN